MSILQSFTGEVVSFEEYDPETTVGYHDFEKPEGYGCTRTDMGNVNSNRLRVLSLTVGAATNVKCLADPALLKLGEESKVKIIFAGSDIAALVNKETGHYVFYHKALRKKFIVPKIEMGIKCAFVALIAGYIVNLFVAHQNLPGLGLTVKLTFAGLIFLSLAYSAYASNNPEKAHNSMANYLKKVMST